ncbi:MAG TPA: hypothetical protein DF667_01625, partial [Roseburia sp.]|nr:hypothetical protein [Roseburia sp.]
QIKIFSDKGAIMEKIFGIIKKALLSEMLNRIILDVCIVALLVLSILVLFIPVNNIGAKIIVIGYLVSTMMITVFLRIPSIPTEMRFRKTSIWSFLTWNVFYSVIIGVITGCVISKVKEKDIIQCSIAATSLVTIIIAMLWFIYQIWINKSDNTAELDLYSSIMVAALTLLSLAFDYSSIKIPFLIIFFIYLAIQTMIKVKICIIKAKN